MTPKEKAKELIDKYLSIQFGDFPTTDAKQCALIAVDEIMECLNTVMIPNPFKQYWGKVKSEINQL